MADFLFDGPNRLILEPASASAGTTHDVTRDIYSAWKRWLRQSDNAKYLAAFSVEGGTPIGATGLFTGTTFVLLNGWKLKPVDVDGQTFIDGNLYSADGVASVPADSASRSMVFNVSVAAQGISTTPSASTGLTEEERAALFSARDHARAANSQTQRED